MPPLNRPANTGLTTWVLMLLLAVCAGAVLAFAVHQDNMPPELAPAPTATSYRLTTEPTTDKREVRLQAVLAPSANLNVATTGLVTASDCRIGGSVKTGSAPLSIDGTHLLALATAQPLWRDLTRGDQGTDVRGWQQALRTAGHSVSVTGVIDTATLTATQRLYRTLAVPFDGTIHRASILWLPRQTVVIATCPARVGDSIATNTPWASQQPALQSLTVSPWPNDLLHGARTLTVDAVVVPVSADGAVVEPLALNRLGQTPTMARFTTDPASPIGGTIQLATPIESASLLPSSLFAIDGTVGCIASTDGATHQVTLLTSTLGRTLVSINTKPWPTDVLIEPPATARCAAP
jgi:hypothetical protein